MGQQLTIQQINSRKPEKSRLAALEFVEPRYSKTGKKIRMVLCRCDCGVEKVIIVKCLFANTYSCGCYNKELYSTNSWRLPLKYDTIEKVKEAMAEDSWLIPIRFLEPKLDKRGYTQPVVECICTCGNTSQVNVYHLVHQKIKSCGCWRVETCSRFRKYPGNVKEIRSSYDAMIRRCYDETCEEYGYYGAIGVIVCPEWRNDYMSFLNWAKENGWKKGLEIDKDKNGDGYLYSPETCEWITHAENMRYTKRSTVYEYQGEMRTATEIGRMNGIKGDKLSDKLKSGLSIEDAIALTIKNRIKQNRYGKVK